MHARRQSMEKAIALVLMSLALGPALDAQKAKDLTDPTKVPRMPAAELQTLVAKDQVVLVDVRSAQAYAAGHHDGAISIPAAEIESRAAELRRRAGKRQVVLYCSCPFEYTAADAAVTLARLGVTKVSVLSGGYRGGTGE